MKRNSVAAALSLTAIVLNLSVTNLSRTENVAPAAPMISASVTHEHVSTPQPLDNCSSPVDYPYICFTGNSGLALTPVPNNNFSTISGMSEEALHANAVLFLEGKVSVQLDNPSDYRRTSSILAADVYNWLESKGNVLPYTLKSAVDSVHMLDDSYAGAIQKICDGGKFCVRGDFAFLTTEALLPPPDPGAGNSGTPSALFPPGYRDIHEMMHLLSNYPIKQPGSDLRLRYTHDGMAERMSLFITSPLNFDGTYLDSATREPVQAVFLWGEDYTESLVHEYLKDRLSKDIPSAYPLASGRAGAEGITMKLSEIGLDPGSPDIFMNSSDPSSLFIRIGSRLDPAASYNDKLSAGFNFLAGAMP